VSRSHWWSDTDVLVAVYVFIHVYV